MRVRSELFERRYTIEMVETEPPGWNRPALRPIFLMHGQRGISRPGNGGVTKMTDKPGASRIFAIALLLTAFLVPASANAIEVKKELNVGGGGARSGGGPEQSGPAPKNPLNQAQQRALFDAVANDSDQFLAQESEKKSSGQPYVDLEKAAFSYMPKGSDAVEAKLTGSEYKPRKSDPTKGTPTGKKKALVFDYKFEGTKFTSSEPPKWEDVDAGSEKEKAAK